MSNTSTIVPSVAIRAFEKTDIECALRLWSTVDGLGLTGSDTEAPIEGFLTRNPGLSAVATVQAELVGAVLCGHNGRAGFLYHLAVAEPYRGRGIATQLLEFCFRGLADAGIPRCNIFVYTANESGNQFWLRRGWDDPSTWKVLQKRITN